MIPAAHITYWRSEAPWPTDAQVEQDLVLSRALVLIFKSNIGDSLALRGGTAINKLLLKKPVRYSEDIDLVQLTPGPIGPFFDGIKDILNPWLGDPVRDIRESTATLKYRFYSEIEPVEPLRLKIEINTREHDHFLDLQPSEFSVSSPWFRGNSRVITYEVEELMATKFRALYQRSKGRDLFDLWFVIMNAAPDCARILTIFRKYMELKGTVPSTSEFMDNLDKKLIDSAFTEDTKPLLRAGYKYDPEVAGNTVKEELICKLDEEMQ